MSLKDLPADLRPREKLLARGPAALADASDALFAVLDDIQSAHDMDAAMSRMLSAVVAADDDVALCKSAEQAAVMARRDAETMRDTLRSALEEALSETGCPAVVSGHHIAELREGRPSVVVTDPDAQRRQAWSKAHAEVGS